MGGSAASALAAGSRGSCRAASAQGGLHWHRLSQQLQRQPPRNSNGAPRLRRHFCAPQARGPEPQLLRCRLGGKLAAWSQPVPSQRAAENPKEDGTVACSVARPLRRRVTSDSLPAEAEQDRPQPLQLKHPPAQRPSRTFTHLHPNTRLHSECRCSLPQQC